MTRKNITWAYGFWTFIGTIAMFLIAASIALVGMPSLISPVPLLGFFLAALLSFGYFIFWPLVFLICAFTFLKNNKKIPLSSKCVAILAVVLSILWFNNAWNYGLKYQGVEHTHAMLLYNIAIWAVLFLIYRFNKRHPTIKSNFMFHWVLIAWFAWGFLPWLGELP